MQAVRSQIIRMMTECDSVSPPTHQSVDGECDRASLGYYFVMPKTRTKQGRKTVEAGTLCVFGPFDSPQVARFIGTSARALGLVDPDASIQPVPLQEQSQAADRERQARRLQVRTHTAVSSANMSHSLLATC